MLDKTNNEDTVQRQVDKTAPALFVRLQAPVGKERTMELSFGVPLDMTVADMNKYVDKVMLCVDHQNDVGLMLFLKESIMLAEKQIATNMQNIANYERKAEDDWYAKGRHGPWEPTGRESAEIKNFRTTIKDYRENRIPEMQRQLAEIEEKIARGT